MSNLIIINAYPLWFKRIFRLFTDTPYMRVSVDYLKPISEEEISKLLYGMGYEIMAVQDKIADPPDDFQDMDDADQKLDIEKRLLDSCRLLFAITNPHPRHGTATMIPLVIRSAADKMGGYVHAFKVAFDWMAKELNIRKVHIRVLPVDPIADTLVKAGFRKEGTLEQELYIDGQFVDVQILGNVIK